MVPHLATVHTVRHTTSVQAGKTYDSRLRDRPSQPAPRCCCRVAQCGAEELLPRFSGAVSSPNGRYARQRFSPDECRQRHADVVAALTTLYELA